jgi:phosphatidylserine/phosphatidylglycerophosphate/cardiolipin synthase-like enzyme
MERLQAGGARVYEDSLQVTTHAKVMIVDSDFVVIGSTNWSYHALHENNESAAIIESAALNEHYARYIEDLIRAGREFDRGT